MTGTTDAWAAILGVLWFAFAYTYADSKDRHATCAKHRDLEIRSKINKLQTTKPGGRKRRNTHPVISYDYIVAITGNQERRMGVTNNIETETANAHSNNSMAIAENLEIANVCDKRSVDLAEEINMGTARDAQDISCSDRKLQNICEGILETLVDNVEQVTVCEDTITDMVEEVERRVVCENLIVTLVKEIEQQEEQDVNTSTFADNDVVESVGTDSNQTNTRDIPLISGRGVEEAVYKHKNGNEEVVKIIKSHPHNEGGGFTIYIPSTRNERSTTADKLNFQVLNEGLGPARNSTGIPETSVEPERNETDPRKSDSTRLVNDSMPIFKEEVMAYSNQCLVGFAKSKGIDTKVYNDRELLISACEQKLESIRSVYNGYGSKVENIEKTIRKIDKNLSGKASIDIVQERLAQIDCYVNNGLNEIRGCIQRLVTLIGIKKSLGLTDFEEVTPGHLRPLINRLIRCKSRAELSRDKMDEIRRLNKSLEEGLKHQESINPGSTKPNAYVDPRVYRRIPGGR